MREIKTASGITVMPGAVIGAMPNYVDTVNGERVFREVQGDIIIGKGVYIGENSCVTFGMEESKPTIIEENTIIGHLCNIGHGCRIGKSVILSVGVLLCGEVSIGDHSYLGAGTIVLPNKTIGKQCVIGSGTKICKNVPDNTIIRENTSWTKKKNRWRPT